MKHAATAFSLTLCCLALGSCRVCPPEGLRLTLLDTAGAVHRPVQELEVGDSLSIALDGLSPDGGVEVFLHDDLGREWSYARLFADAQGRIAPTLLWYQSGVIGETSRNITFEPEPAFRTFEEAEAFFEQHALRLSVRDLRGAELRAETLRLQPRRTPFLYPSDEQGILRNALDQSSEDLFVTGRNFPPGATVHLHAVDNQHVWNIGDPLLDRTGTGRRPDVETIQLAPGQTAFTARVWRHENARVGAYDLVARIGDELGDPVLRPDDVLSFNDDTGVLYFLIINGNIVIDAAGRMKSGPAKFEFSDSFEKLEDVYAAVDPTDVPAVHSGGSYAAYWVVAHQDASYWDAANPALADVTPGVEIHRVKYWCINATRRLVWAGATQADPIKGYDVVVDFGAVPATDSASFVHDGTYDKGTDFLDGYGDVGFWLFEDPGSAGPFPVAQVELDDPAGISGITDPAGVTGPTQSVTQAWARIMYPGAGGGAGLPVSPLLPEYPVALFLHGRHVNCDADGAGPGLSGSYSFSCPTSQRVPSHEGYNYIMEKLASQGIFCISISAHDIQPGLGAWDYDARGRLILKFLDKLRDWNDNGTDPFGGIFGGRLDMSRVALSGHSRGGEGVVAAQELNLTWPAPHSIVAVNAIAPTDQNSVSYLMTAAPYYLLMPARDGDVSSMQGYRTYDRAFPEGATGRHDKTVAWVYEANHNYFNTIWTDTAALGSANPWAGSVDDAPGTTPAMAAATQRQVALTTIAAFFRQHLQDIEPYREVFTGRVRPAALPDDLVFWTFQDEERKAVDDFEQTPLDKTKNSLNGNASATGFTTFDENLLNATSTDYTDVAVLATQDNRFWHDTIGLRLGWGGSSTYTTELPAGHRDVSAYTHLTLRAGKRVTGAPGTGPDVNLFVNIEDGSGNKALWDLRTDQFDRIPHPFEGSEIANQAILNGVRIPLRNFTQNNSGVDLTDVRKITIRAEGTGEIGIDDIEFGK